MIVYRLEDKEGYGPFTHNTDWPNNYDGDKALQFKNTSELVEYLADGDATHGYFTNMQRQQVQQYLSDGTIEVFVLEHHWQDDYGGGIEVEDYFTIEEAREYALQGDRILRVIEEIL